MGRSLFSVIPTTPQLNGINKIKDYCLKGANAEISGLSAGLIG